MPAARGPLFPMIGIDGRMGFIDTSGRVVIAPRFHAVGGFSEGLAPAREGGLYGYIDGTGEYVISPRWDYATEFRYGRAVVYEDSIPIVIDRTGRKVFGGAFAAIEPYEHGVAWVGTGTEGRWVDRWGLVDTTGRLVLDTVCSRAEPFEQGLSIVKGIRGRYTVPFLNQVAIVDTTGRFVVPFGRYDGISYLGDGRFEVSSIADTSDWRVRRVTKLAWIDRTGREVRLARADARLEGRFESGLAPARLASARLAAQGYDWFRGPADDRCGYIDTLGNIAFGDSAWESVSEFHDGRAFVATGRSDFWLINRQGRTLNARPFDDADGINGFRNGFAVVAVDGHRGVIDTNGRFIVAPGDDFGGLQVLETDSRHLYIRSVSWSSSEGRGELLHGILRADGTELLPAILDEYDRRGFRNGLLACRIEGALAYVNEGGRIVWREMRTKSRRTPWANVDFQVRGGYFVGERIAAGDTVTRTGYWAGAPRASKIPWMLRVPRDTVSVTVRAWRKRDFRSSLVAPNRPAVRGITVIVANTTGRTASFAATAGRLPLRLQALDPQGVWRDIEEPEYMTNCVESCTEMRTLEPGEHWVLAAPRYDGSFKTQLRFVLEFFFREDISDRNAPRHRAAYSKPFPGRINPAQLWRKVDPQDQPYSDPYLGW